jgi:hypothetical protein
MNKKQLIVAWIAIILVCFTLISYPKKHLKQLPNGVNRYYDEPHELYGEIITSPVIQWVHVAPLCISFLLIGGLLIYTFKG